MSYPTHTHTQLSSSSAASSSSSSTIPNPPNGLTSPPPLSSPHQHTTSSQPYLHSTELSARQPSNGSTSPTNRYVPFRAGSPSRSVSRGGSEGVGMGMGASGSAGAIARGVGGRLVRMGKRGNLPFVIVFLSCVIIFFSALLGIGYVDPDADLAPDDPAGAKGFMPGSPVFDTPPEQVRRARMEEQKQLEQQWMKKKRPNAGAWMQKQRDDKAVRRRPAHILNGQDGAGSADNGAAQVAEEAGEHANLRKRTTSPDELEASNEEVVRAAEAKLA